MKSVFQVNLDRTGLLFVFLVVLVSLESFAEVSFRGLGENSKAYGVSADGTAVIGNLGRWKESEGWVYLGLSPCSVSKDGSIIVGKVAHENSEYHLYPYSYEAYFWKEGVGVELIGNPSGNRDTSAVDVSHDGSIIVGYSRRSQFSNSLSSFTNSFIYNMNSGEIENLCSLPGDSTASLALAVSGDGRIVLGTGNPDHTNVEKAVLWSENREIEMIINSCGLCSSSLRASSYDGSIVAGNDGFFVIMQKSYIWNRKDGIVYLGELPNRRWSEVNDISANGRVVVGVSFDDFEDDISFYWSEETGMVDLREMLVDTYNIDLDGWVLTEAVGISADCKVIVGNGTNPDGVQEGWKVSVDVDGDVDADGDVDLDDFVLLASQWQLEKLNWDIYPYGGDGIVNIIDWVVLSRRWNDDFDESDLTSFANEWLKKGAYNADIAPMPYGDGIVNLLDFELFCRNWLR